MQEQYSGTANVDFDVDSRTLDQQVKCVLDENTKYYFALKKSLDLVNKLIKENMDIRRLANLPSVEYPKEIVVDNTHWHLENYFND